VITLLRAVAADVPGHDEWLLPAERATQAGLHVAKRRAEWRLGRWAAKHAVALAQPHLEPQDVEIRAAPDGAPEARDSDGRRLGVALSLSHRDGVAVCAVAAPPQPLGCDVESVEKRAPAFAREWCSAREQAMLAAAPPTRRDLLITVLWSAKESVLKLRRSGLREDPRAVEIQVQPDAFDAAGWAAFHTAHGCDGRWRVDGQLVITVALRPASSASGIRFASLHHGRTDP